MTYIYIYKEDIYVEKMTYIYIKNKRMLANIIMKSLLLLSLFFFFKKKSCYPFENHHSSEPHGGVIKNHTILDIT